MPVVPDVATASLTLKPYPGSCNWISGFLIDDNSTQLDAVMQDDLNLSLRWIEFQLESRGETTHFSLQIDRSWSNLVDGKAAIHPGHSVLKSDPSISTPYRDLSANHRCSRRIGDDPRHVLCTLQQMNVDLPALFGQQFKLLRNRIGKAIGVGLNRVLASLEPTNQELTQFIGALNVSRPALAAERHSSSGNGNAVAGHSPPHLTAPAQSQLDSSDVLFTRFDGHRITIEQLWIGSLERQRFIEIAPTSIKEQETSIRCRPTSIRCRPTCCPEEVPPLDPSPRERNPIWRQNSPLDSHRLG